MKNLPVKKTCFAELQGLEQRLKRASNITDKGERLLELQDIRTSSENIFRKTAALPQSIFLVGLYSGLIGIFALGPASALAPLVMVGATLLGLGGSVLTLGAGRQNLKLAKSIYRDVEDRIRTFISDEDPLPLAASPHFKQVMAVFPALRESFILAAAKQAAQPQEKSGVSANVTPPSINRSKLNL